MILKKVYELSNDELTAIKDGNLKGEQASIVFKDSLKMKAILALLNELNPMVLLKTKEGWSQLKVADIIYLESFKDEMSLYVNNQSVIVHEPLYQLETLLEPYHFVRIAKSYVVNISKIVAIKTSFNAKLALTLTNGQVLEVTRSYVNSFKKILNL